MASADGVRTEEDSEASKVKPSVAAELEQINELQEKIMALRHEGWGAWMFMKKLKHSIEWKWYSGLNPRNYLLTHNNRWSPASDARLLKF